MGSAWRASYLKSPHSIIFVDEDLQISGLLDFHEQGCPSLNNAALWTVLFLKIARKLFSISLCIRLKRRRLSMILVSATFLKSLPYYKCFHLIANDRNQFSWTKWNWANIEEKSAFKEMKRNSTYKWRLHALAFNNSLTDSDDVQMMIFIQV